MSISKTPDLRRNLIYLLLVAVIAAAYLPLVHNLFLNYDDPGYITRNEAIRSGLTPGSFIWAFTATIESNWHPLTWISHALDVTISGFNPAGHHIMSLLIHCISTLLLFSLMRRMTSDDWKSAFVAAVFALHPLHVESVAWAAERKDVLAGLFLVLTLLAYEMYSAGQKWKWYAAAIVFYCLGLMSKPSIVPLPLVLFLVDYWSPGLKPAGDKPALPGGKMRILFSRKNLLPKMPFMILAAASAVVTVWVQSQGGLTALPSSVTFGVRCANAIHSYTVYLGKIFFPDSLAVFYPYPVAGIPLFVTGAEIALLLVITIVVWRLRFRAPYLIFGWLWYLISLVPEIGLLQVGLQAMADRYTYVPIIGIAVMLAWGIPDLLRRFDISPKLAAIGAALAVLLMVIVTRDVVPYWRDSITLFSHAIAVTKDNDVAETNLGAAYADSGRYAEAITHLRIAARLKPDEILIRSDLARSLALNGENDEALREYFWIRERINPDVRLYSHIGDIYADQGKLDSACSEYRKILVIDSSANDIRCRLGLLLLEKGDSAGARREAETALKMQSTSSPAYDLLGVIAASSARADIAQKDFDEAVRLDSSNAIAFLHMGMLAEENGREDDAVRCFTSSVAMAPGNWSSQLHLGTALARTGRVNDAVPAWENAIRLNPGAIEAHINLGRYAGMKGRTAEAAAHFLAALAIDSTSVPALFNYGTFLAQNQRFAEAAGKFSTILHFNPGYEPARQALAQLKDQPH
jgi:protein O-mannosyl-transferase